METKKFDGLLKEAKSELTQGLINKYPLSTKKRFEHEGDYIKLIKEIVPKIFKLFKKGFRKIIISAVLRRVPFIRPPVFLIVNH